MKRVEEHSSRENVHVGFGAWEGGCVGAEHTSTIQTFWPRCKSTQHASYQYNVLIVYTIQLLPGPRMTSFEPAWPDARSRADRAEIHHCLIV